MHHGTELSFIDEFRCVSPLHYLKKRMTDAVLLWWMLQVGLPSLHYYCVVMLHSCIVLPSVGHSSNHEYHCCQLTRQSSCVSNSYRTLKVFIWLSLILNILRTMTDSSWPYKERTKDDPNEPLKLPTRQFYTLQVKLERNDWKTELW